MKTIKKKLTNWRKLHNALCPTDAEKKINEVADAIERSKPTIYRHMANSKALRNKDKIAIAKIYKVELNKIFPPQTKAL